MLFADCYYDYLIKDFEMSKEYSMHGEMRHAYIGRPFKSWL
jgi:hypothetical protein